MKKGYQLYLSIDVMNELQLKGKNVSVLVDGFLRDYAKLKVKSLSENQEAVNQELNQLKGKMVELEKQKQKLDKKSKPRISLRFESKKNRKRR